MNKLLFSMLFVSVATSFAMKDSSAKKGINDLTPEQAKEALSNLQKNIEDNKELASDGFTAAILQYNRNKLQQRAAGKQVAEDDCKMQ